MSLQIDINFYGPQRNLFKFRSLDISLGSEKEPESTGLYRRLFLDYAYGLDRIYTAEEIQAAKASPSFEREYNLKYLGLLGDIFHTKDIDDATEQGGK